MVKKAEYNEKPKKTENHTIYRQKIEIVGQSECDMSEGPLFWPLFGPHSDLLFSYKH